MSLSALLTDTAQAVREACDESPIDSAGALRELSAQEVLELGRLAGELSRIADALGAVVSSEITHRVQTDAEFRRGALGGDVGGRFASELLREFAHVDDDTVRAWEKVGDAITPRTTLQGEVLPCRHEALAEAVLAARVPASHAAMIVRGVDAVADRTGTETLTRLEATLVDYAGSLTTRQLGKLFANCPTASIPTAPSPATTGCVHARASSCDSCPMD